MDGFWTGMMSKKSGTSKSEQGRQISRISDLLQHHRDHVYGVLHTVNIHHAHVESIVYAQRNESTDTSFKQAPTNEADDEPEYARGRSFEERTRDLFASIQNSLQCQCSALERSFKGLNMYINDTLENFKDPADEYIGSPVDIDYSKQWIPYNNCPYPEINNTTKDKLKELEEREKLLQENIQLNNLKIHSLEKENDKLKSTIAKYEMKINTLEQSVESKTTEITELENQKTTLMENITTKDEKNKNYAKELDDLKRDRGKLQEILSDKQDNRQVQLFYHTRGDLMSKVIDGLKSLLVEKLVTDRNKIHFVDCVSEKDVDPNLPLFLMCAHASTIDSDVGTALQKLEKNVTSNVCVLVIHCKDLHALPHPLSDRVLSGPDFQGLGGIYDIAFLSEKGIYSCEMNKTSANGIVQFLTRHALQKHSITYLSR